ncbi:MAG: outer membrane beta-barrel protein [Woeseiaceae bacterium]|nr:outer membrane beta-barrel protein [Woeseiaceae bacterium]
MNLVRTIFVISACTCLTPPVLASENKFELTPYGGYRFGGKVSFTGAEGSYELDDSTSFGMILNWHHTGNTQWELIYAQQSTDAELRDSTEFSPSVETEMHSLELGGTYQGDGETARPYLALTLGGTHIRADANGSESDTFFSASIGAGFQFFPSRQFGLRLEGRARAILINSSTDLFCSTGPDANVCAIQVRGDTLNQFETFAGFTFRF